MDNAILKPENNVLARIAQRTLAKRGVGYASEVRRLLDAALEVMRQGGTASRPRVADIVAAGLSNDAFYRHFPSKDALVGVIDQLQPGGLTEPGTDPLAVGVRLLDLFDRLQSGGQVVVLAIDDLHWCQLTLRSAVSPCCLRSSRLRTLPAPEIGSAPAKATLRGSL